jgi:uncharacterized protein YrrD
MIISAYQRLEKSMIITFEQLQSTTVEAKDGHIGQVTDLLFDDQSWVIRYLVVETGSWLQSRKVLISPISVVASHWNTASISVALTRKQVQDSPDIDVHQTVSRQQELSYFSHYGYPTYWGGIGIWGAGVYPGSLTSGFNIVPLEPEDELQKSLAAQADGRRQSEDPHLRSIHSVIGYHIKAKDGEIGHVAGMLFDDKQWTIRYLELNTSNWWLGHTLLIPPRWAIEIDWASAMVTVPLLRQNLQEAPQYEVDMVVNRALEHDIYRHYGQPPYWSDAVSPN